MLSNDHGSKEVSTKQVLALAFCGGFPTKV